ncbi:hypothetical protein OROMI_032454 [Orobanche minor]
MSLAVHQDREDIFVGGEFPRFKARYWLNRVVENFIGQGSFQSHGSERIQCSFLKMPSMEVASQLHAILLQFNDDSVLRSYGTVSAERSSWLVVEPVEQSLAHFKLNNKSWDGVSIADKYLSIVQDLLSARDSLLSHKLQHGKFEAGDILISTSKYQDVHVKLFKLTVHGSQEKTLENFSSVIKEIIGAEEGNVEMTHLLNEVRGSTWTIRRKSRYHPFLQSAPGRVKFPLKVDLAARYRDSTLRDIKTDVNAAFKPGYKWHHLVNNHPILHTAFTKARLTNKDKYPDTGFGNFKFARNHGLHTNDHRPQNVPARPYGVVNTELTKAFPNLLNCVYDFATVEEIGH